MVIDTKEKIFNHPASKMIKYYKNG